MVCLIKTFSEMGLTVEIDKASGFCAGVIGAITKAEDFLERTRKEGENRKLFSLGAIVHNDLELQRLERHGLVSIDKDDLNEIRQVDGETLLIRAHGEPPETFALARGKGFNVIDCTCPVVLKLQEKIKEAHARLTADGRKGQIIIFGKIGHAEVLGLTGQVGGDAVVVEDLPMLEALIADGTIDITVPTEVFSQTTKSPAEYATICSRLEELMAGARELSVERFKGTHLLTVHNTICAQVASRHGKLSRFALEHDVVIFVAGKASSNGKVLCSLCKSVNIRTYYIGGPADIRKEWFRDDDKVGVCGATSTPKWLLEEVADYIKGL